MKGNVKKIFSVILVFAILLTQIAFFSSAVNSTDVKNVVISPLTIIENTNGWWNGDHFEYYLYSNEWSFYVELKGGTKLYAEYGYLSYEGVDYCIEIIHDQSEKPLKRGKNEIDVSIMGYTTKAVVEIVSSPVESVNIKPVKIIKNTNGHWNETYFSYHLNSIDFDYTVKLNNGAILESDNGDIHYDNRWYGIDFINDIWDYSFVLGKNEIEVSILGYRTKAVVEIIETPVKALNIEPIILYEGIDGNWSTRYNPETGVYEQFFEYSFNNNIEFSIDLKNGIHLQSSDYGVYYNGDYFTLNFVYNQYSKPLKVGKNYVEVSVLGYTTTVVVEVKESPVKSISVEPIKLIENTDGYWSTYYDEIKDEYVEYFDYNISTNDLGNGKFYVELKDGTILESKDGSVYFNGYHRLNTSYEEFENPFQLGENEIEVSVMGYKTKAIVEIVETPVVSVNVEPITYIKNGDCWFHVPFSATFKDGTVINSDDYGYLRYNNNDYEIQFDEDLIHSLPVGTHEIELTFMNCPTLMTVEVIETPIESIEFDYTEYDGFSCGNWETDENGDDYFNYYLYDIGYVVTLNDGTKIYSMCNTAQFGVKIYGQYYDSNFTSDQFENHWGAGKHQFTCVVAGKSATGYVNIVSNNNDNFIYDEIDGGIVITGINDNSIDILDIPSYINEKKVVGIAYLGAKGASEIIVPDTVKFISTGWLVDCYNVKKITLGASVDRFSIEMFSGIPLLEEINVSPNNKNYMSYDGVLYSKDGTSFVAYPLGKGNYYFVPSFVKDLDNFVNNKLYDDITIDFSLSSNFKTIDGVTYTLDMKKVIYCDTEKSGDYVMPDSVEEISDYAFKNSSLESVIISKNVTEIVYGVFANCTELKNVEIPTGVKSIGRGSFSNCTSLEYVSVPDSVVQLQGESFKNCYSLSSVDLNNVKVIEDSTFENCSSLSRVKFSDSLTKINHDAFSYCSSLKSIILPESLERIGYNAFRCSGLESVAIPDSVTEIESSAFAECYNLKKVDLSNGVTTITGSCFSNCISIESIVIPMGVRSIEWSAFHGCKKLSSITIPDSIEMVNYGIFDETALVDNTNYEDGFLYIGNILYDVKESVSGDVTVRPGTKIIAPYVFSNCPDITSIELPYGLKYIGGSTFCGSQIKSIKIPETVTEIIYGAFRDSSIKNIEIPNAATNLDDGIFRSTQWYELQDEGLVYLDSIFFGYKGYMDELSHITIKDGTKALAARAFCEQDNLIGVTIPDGVINIGRIAFYDCSRLKQVILPDSVKYIGISAFAACKSLELLELGNGVEEICGNIINGTRIKKIDIPATTKKIDPTAFYGCDTLEEINVDENNQYYSSIDGVLYNKDGTKLLYCPRGKTGTVTIAEKVVSVRTGSFNDSKVQKIIVENDDLIIGENAFGTCISEYWDYYNPILLCAREGSTTDDYARTFSQPFEILGSGVEEPEYEYDFYIQTPSRTTIRHRDGIILHINSQATLPKGSYIVWKYENSNFDVEEAENGMKLIATAEDKGWTVFTATLYDVDGNVLATDSVELYSKSGLFDKIGSFFRALFGATKIYDK